MLLLLHGGVELHVLHGLLTVVCLRFASHRAVRLVCRCFIFSFCHWLQRRSWGDRHRDDDVHCIQIHG